MNVVVVELSAVQQLTKRTTTCKASIDARGRLVALPFDVGLGCWTHDVTPPKKSSYKSSSLTSNERTVMTSIWDLRAMKTKCMYIYIIWHDTRNVNAQETFPPSPRPHHVDYCTGYFRQQIQLRVMSEFLLNNAHSCGILSWRRIEIDSVFYKMIKTIIVSGSLWHVPL